MTTIHTDATEAPNTPTNQRGFEGFLGKGAMHAMYPIGKDVWSLICQRAMDAPAPGNWTMRIRRDAAGKVDGLVAGCWLARNIEYRKVS